MSPHWTEWVVFGLLILWCTYSINGFRGWWVTITVSDADAGSAIRQLLFAGSAATAGLLLLHTKTVWHTFTIQR